MPSRSIVGAVLNVWASKNELDGLIWRSFACPTELSRFRSASHALDKTLPIPAIGRDLVDNRPIGDEQQVREVFAKLAGFAMTHKHRVAWLERYGALIPDGRLHLACSFKRIESCSLRQIRPRLLLGTNRARGDIAPT